MIRVRFSLLLMGTLACSASGCASCGDEAEPAEQVGAAGEQAAAPPPEALPTPTIEQLPLPQDFALHAGQRVSEDTYAAELERLEQEIGLAPEPERVVPTAVAPATVPTER